MAELEAAVQALRGYASEVRAVNEEIEARAGRALGKVDALERHVGPAVDEAATGYDDTGGDADTGGLLGVLRG